MLATRMLEIIVALVSMFVSPDDADALTSTAPRYLTRDTAREHIAASVVIGTITRTDPSMLLSIAHHESRYQHGEVTPELGGKVSCGVMTPEPTYSRRACSDATRSIAAGYLAGARHLRGWLDVCRDNERCAMLGYAGGFALIDACSREKKSGCYAPFVFEQRATLIMRALKRARSRSRKLAPLRLDTGHARNSWGSITMTLVAKGKGDDR